MSFGVLTVIVLAGLAGPLLGSGGRVPVPVVAGELLAGLLLGRSGFGWLRPDEPTLAFLANIGFAMLMLSAGMHVPLRQPAILARVRRGALGAVVGGLLALGAGWAVTHLVHVGHPLLYAVVLGSGSAAVLVPCLEEFGLLDDPVALTVAAQVALADVASIVLVPLVLRPARAGVALLGLVVVTACAGLLLVVVRSVHTRSWVHRLRQRSKERDWALDLRLSLIVLFALCWVTVRTGASILIAGFAVGLVVAAVGGPKRLSRQVTGIGQGFFVPLFFVVLGARVDLRALIHRRSLVELALLLVLLDVALHVLAALATRQPFVAGLAATVQLGVPAAVVSLGLQEKVVSAGVGAAVMVAALASIVVSTGGVLLLERRRPPRPVTPVLALPRLASGDR